MTHEYDVLNDGEMPFEMARLTAMLQQLGARLRGRSNRALNFEEIRSQLHVHQQINLGLQDVPLDQIVGSVGRYQDFNRDFLPLNRDIRDRWTQVYARMNSLEGLPPVKLYKIADVYFVIDGNHRVSVWRQIGAKSIEAEVIELPSPFELHPEMTTMEIRAIALEDEA